MPTSLNEDEFMINHEPRIFDDLIFLSRRLKVNFAGMPNVITGGTC